MALEKLQIQSFSDQACTQSTSAPFSVFINPESYSRNSTILYKDLEIVADSAKSKIFMGMGDDSLSLTKLMVDGTGIMSLGSYRHVDDYLDKFREVVSKYNGDMHQPNFLMVTWGTLSFKGVCKSFNINYLLFKPDGSTLRATIDITLTKSIDLATKTKKAKKSSPDLTHIRRVKAGDTLPLMTYRIYGDSSFYLEVARVNGLKNINSLKPGDEIYFPPLKK